MVDFSWQGRAALGSLLDIQGVNYQYLLVLNIYLDPLTFPIHRLI